MKSLFRAYECNTINTSLPPIICYYCFPFNAIISNYNYSMYKCCIATKLIFPKVKTLIKVVIPINVCFSNTIDFLR